MNTMNGGGLDDDLQMIAMKIQRGQALTAEEQQRWYQHQSTSGALVGRATRPTDFAPPGARVGSTGGLLPFQGDPYPVAPSTPQPDAYAAGQNDRAQAEAYNSGQAGGPRPGQAGRPQPATPEQHAGEVSSAGARLPVGQRLGNTSVAGGGVYADPRGNGQVVLSQDNRTPLMDASGIGNASPMTNPGRITLQARSPVEAPAAPAAAPAGQATIKTVTPREQRKPATAPVPDYGLVGKAAGAVGSAARSVARAVPAANEAIGRTLIGTQGMADLRAISLNPFSSPPATLPSPEEVAASPGTFALTPPNPADFGAGLTPYSQNRIRRLAKPYQAAADRFNPFATMGSERRRQFSN